MNELEFFEQEKSKESAGSMIRDYMDIAYTAKGTLELGLDATPIIPILEILHKLIIKKLGAK